MRSRAKDEGLLRPPCGSVLSSASSGCVGRSLKGLGRNPRDLNDLAGFEGCTTAAGVACDAGFASELKADFRDEVMGRFDATGIMGTPE